MPKKSTLKSLALDRNWLIEEVQERWGELDAVPQGSDGLPTGYPVEFARPFRTRDGRRLFMRPILPDDGPRLVGTFQRLSADTIYKRFHQHLDHLSEEQVRYLTHVDYRSHFALVALRLASGEGVGVARYYLPREGFLAESAIVVADAWQGQGVGKALLRRLVRAARARNITGFEAFVQSDNDPILHLIERGGWRLHRKQERDCLHIWFRFDDRLV